MPQDAGPLRTRVVASCAGIDHLLGDHARATARLRTSLAEVEGEPSPESTALKTQLAANAFFSGDFAVAAGVVEGGARGRGRARQRGRPRGGDGAARLRGLHDRRRRTARARTSASPRTCSTQLDESEVGRHLTSFTWAGVCEVYLERFDRALAVQDRCLQTARALGQDFVSALARLSRSLALGWRGRLAEAADEADAAVETAELLGQDQFLTWALWVRAWIAHQAGDLGLAERLGVRSVELGRDAEDPVTVMAHCYLAETRFERGAEPAAVLEQVLAAAGGPELPLIERAFRARWYEFFTRAELRRGRRRSRGRVGRPRGRRGGRARPGRPDVRGAQGARGGRARTRIGRGGSGARDGGRRARRPNGSPDRGRAGAGPGGAGTRRGGPSRERPRTSCSRPTTSSASTAPSTSATRRRASSARSAGASPAAARPAPAMDSAR